MLDTKLRQLFRRGRLYEKEVAFGVIVCYDLDNVIRIERFFRPDERRDLYNMIFDLYFEYEYNWQPISARKIAKLLWVHHSTVDRVLLKIKYQIKNWMNYLDSN